MKSGGQRLVTVAQWGSLLCALLLAARGRPDAGVATGAGVLIAIGAAGLDLDIQSRRAQLRAAVVVSGPAVVVAFTGGWVSPFLPCVIPPVLAVGMSFGFTAATATALLSVLVASRLEPTVEVLAWTLELALLAVLGAHVRRLEATAAPLAELQTTNRLLVELQALAHNVPVTTDVEEAVRSTATTIREVLHADIVEVVIHDGLRVVAGTRNGDNGHVREVELSTGAQHPLGALVVRRATALSKAERSVLDSAATQAALAIDNAIRLQRIRDLAVAEERRRLARDLHDQFGQELASLGYMLDRVAATPPHEIAPALASARAAVARLVSELREALTDLRARVDDEAGLAGSLGAFLERVGQRSGLRTRLDAEGAPRLPATIERELLHIAQEAVINAERHARATSVEVRLVGSADGAVLQVVDNGTGVNELDRPGHYGLVGMRERARCLGADVTIDSNPRRGTTIECRISL